jgi:hypothetical protein
MAPPAICDKMMPMLCPKVTKSPLPNPIPMLVAARVTGPVGNDLGIKVVAELTIPLLNAKSHPPNAMARNSRRCLSCNGSCCEDARDGFASLVEPIPLPSLDWQSKEWRAAAEAKERRSCVLRWTQLSSEFDSNVIQISKALCSDADDRSFCDRVCALRIFPISVVAQRVLSVGLRVSESISNERRK